MHMLRIYDLKTEYRTNPYGIDASHPRFSWKLESDKQGVVQKKYRIIVNCRDEILWDSGEVLSDESQRIRYEGKTLESRMDVFWKVSVTVQDENGTRESAESESANFTMGLLQKSDWKGQWIEPEEVVDTEARKAAPYLRKKFAVKAGLKKAVIYQTAHGLYEFWLNGKLGTNEKFKPGLTSYYHRIQYQMYDISSLLQEGENIWAVMLGDGWWRGTTGGTVKNNFGYKLQFLGQIELFYEDGTTEVIISDESFNTATSGLLASDMMMGDIFDARLELEGWKMPRFDDSGWKSVHLVEEKIDAELIASRSVPVLEKETFEGREIKDASGRRVIDFGQNIAGYVKMKFHNTKPGQIIHLVHGEDIDADGNFSVANINKCVMPVEAFQEITYTCRGGEEEYCPIFSVFGFQYLLVEGYAEEIEAGDFIATAVYSAMEETGDFSCTNPLINKLVENSRWSQKGNFLDVAVDCPTRERNAWTGDNQIYVRTASSFMNVYPFYEKWLKDQAIEQYASGKVGITFPSTSSVHNPEEFEKIKKTNPTSAMAGPTGNGNMGEDCAGWGDSTAWIPYMLYLCYGDKQIIKNQYDTAKKWVDYMLANAKEQNPFYADQPQYHNYEDDELDADYIYDTKMHYGEWQEPIPKENTGESIGEIFARWIREGKPKVATAYMCRSAENVAFMAGVIGKEEEKAKYERIAARIRKVYDKYLIDEDGVIEEGHQAAYVRALVMNLCSEEKRPLVEAQLVKEIEANNYHLNTGFLSTPFLLPVLVEMGRSDLAFRILEQEDYPSWLHPITLGATTIPESWNAFDVHDSSYNHYSYGAVCEFLFSYVAGIKPVFEKPGYKEFILKPRVGGSFTHARAEYESIYGTIVSEWKMKGDKFLYHCEIPANTKAKLVLPNGQEHTLGSGKYDFE